VDVDATLVVVGLTLTVVALTGRIITRLWLSPAAIALVVGVVAGPEVLDVVDVRAAPGDEQGLVREVARITLGVSLVGVGLQLDVDDLRRLWRRVARLLTVGMVGMWLVTGLGAVVLLELPLWTGLLLGAVLTPTDPAVAASMVTGPLARANLPERLRHTLQLESGANDGLALPFVLLAGLAVTPPLGEAVGEWAGQAGKEIGLALVLGAAIGLAVGQIARFDVEHRETSAAHLLMSGVALALLTLGGVHTLGGSGVFAAFVAALCFSASLTDDERELLERTQQAIVHLTLVPMFLLFGATLPWHDWRVLGWPLVAFGAWVLVVRRPPVVPLAMVGGDVRGRSLVWLAWSGPLGVAGIYYAGYVERFPTGHDASVSAAATFAIAVSVLAHTVAATPLARWHAGRSITGTLRHPLEAEADEDEASP
jgi:sodium/hydrogen antiporter